MNARRWRDLLLGGAILLVLLAAPTGWSYANVWRYEDERGLSHFTDNVATVPERYRDALELVEVSPQSNAERRDDPRARRNAGSGNAVSRRLISVAKQNAASPEVLAQIEELEGWLNTWGVAYMLSGIPWGVVSLVSGFHALRRRRFFWALGHGIAWPIVIPFYLLTRFDTVPIQARVAMLAVWTAPFIVGGLALRAVWVQFSAGGIS